MKICARWGDAVNLPELADETFDVTLVLGPLYHLYDRSLNAQKNFKIQSYLSFFNRYSTRSSSLQQFSYCPQTFSLQESDAQIITDGEIAQGWDGEGRLEKYLMRLKDRAEGRSVALAAEFHGAVAGYINIYTDSKWGAFAGLGYP